MLNAEVKYRPKRQLVVHAEGLVLRFLNFYGSQLKQFQRAADEGALVRAYGEVRPGFFGAEMVHPRYRIVAAGRAAAAALTPIYPTTAGLSQYAAAQARARARSTKRCCDDTLPEPVRERYGLPDRARACAPCTGRAGCRRRAELADRTGPAWRRIKFDELLAQQLSMRIAYRARRARDALPLPSNGPLLKRFLGKLPFRLTRAQTPRHGGDPARPRRSRIRCSACCRATSAAARPSSPRSAASRAIDAGCQAAVMAPTEILAEQHLRKFAEWLAPLGVPIVWLHGGLSAAEKNAVGKRLQGAAPLVAIGTHALFQKNVGFARLALAIVDEQHRFGVQQRLALRKKGEAPARSLAPHQLMMSATPIPRTLSMSYFADLDVSTIDELPPGRRGVATRLFAERRRDEVLRASATPAPRASRPTGCAR